MPRLSSSFTYMLNWSRSDFPSASSQSPGLQSSLTEAMKTGSTLAVTGVEGQRLSSNALLSYLLKYPQDTGSRPSKIKVFVYTHCVFSMM